MENHLTGIQNQIRYLHQGKVRTHSWSQPNEQVENQTDMGLRNHIWHELWGPTMYAQIALIIQRT